MFPGVPPRFIRAGCHRCLCSLAVRRVPPRFSIPPTDNEIMPGGSVNITCVAVGSPMPYVKWMLGSEDLTPEDDMPIGRNVLELTDVRQSANYTCVAMSTLGVIEAVAQITVKGEPLLTFLRVLSGFISSAALIRSSASVGYETNSNKHILLCLVLHTVVLCDCVEMHRGVLFFFV